MARKAKIKMKRGTLKLKLKSSDNVLLHGHDGIQALLGAAMSSAMQLSAAATPGPSEPTRQLALPTAVGRVKDAD